MSKMGLPPLEYSDCFLDSPIFREIITLYEQELEQNTRMVKNLVKECNNMITKTEEFSRVQQEFAHALSQFRFQTIGSEKTQDEEEIANSLQSFARLLHSIEDYRHNMLMAIKVRLLKTLENFRKENMKKTLEEKAKFDAASKKYQSFLEGYLNTKPPKKAAGPAANTTETGQFEREKAQFHQSSFDYVCRLQDVHAQKHYELIEPIIGYVSDVTTFLHQAYEEALNLKPQIEMVQFKVQLLRETHENEQEKAYQLKAQVIEEGQQGLVHHAEFLKQGNVYIMGNVKKIGGPSWHKYFCQFRKQGSKKMAKFVCNQKTAIAGVPVDEWLEVEDCIRSKGEEVDRRFCYDLLCRAKGQQYKLIVQAIGNEDRTSWMQVMEGREPVYTSLRSLDVTRITPTGYKFIERCMDTIEDRGLEEEGLYRRPGVLAKCNKLVKDAMDLDPNEIEHLDLSDEIEYDTKTLASAIKGYFARQLGEPLMTFQLHNNFIEAGKINDMEKKIEGISELINQLPKQNKDLLSLLMAHLRNVADLSNINLMKPSNLGVCFGPTLMRPERETVASIVDIRYQNIIVEMLIQHLDKIMPNVRALRPYPRVKSKSITSVKSESSLKSGSVTGSVSDSVGRTETPPPPTSGGTLPRRPAPSAPTKRSIPESSKVTSQQRHMSTISPLTNPPSYGRSNSRDTKSVMLESGQFDHLEPLETGSATAKSKPPVTQKPGYLANRISQYTPSGPPLLPGGGRSRTESTPATTSPVPPPQENKPSTAATNVRRPAPTLPSKPPPPATTFPPGRRAKALYDCEADDPLELAFVEDEILYNVEESKEQDWLMCSNAKNKRGLVPANYVQLL